MCKHYLHQALVVVFLQVLAWAIGHYMNDIQPGPERVSLWFSLIILHLSSIFVLVVDE